MWITEGPAGSGRTTKLVESARSEANRGKFIVYLTSELRRSELLVKLSDGGNYVVDPSIFTLAKVTTGHIMAVMSEVTRILYNTNLPYNKIVLVIDTPTRYNDEELQLLQSIESYAGTTFYVGIQTPRDDSSEIAPGVPFCTPLKKYKPQE